MYHYVFAYSRQSQSRQRCRCHTSSIRTILVFSIGLLLVALVEWTNGLVVSPSSSSSLASSPFTSSKPATTGNDSKKQYVVHQDDFCPSSAYPSFDFLIRERKVSMRSADWSSAMLPIQKYRAVAPVVAAAAATMEQNPKIRPQKSDAPIRQEDPENNKNTTTAAAQLRDILASTTSYPDLSRSSRHMLDKCESLSSRQQEQLLHKIQAEERATTPLDPMESLRILYCDAHICVTNKPSGVLSVPGPRRNPSLAGLVYDCLKPGASVHLDQMVVHRLDMATSGIIVYALSLEALQQLHKDFKDRNVQKTYQALVHGHVVDHHCCQEGEISIALERDPDNPPFMRIAQPKEEEADLDAGADVDVDVDKASSESSSSPSPQEQEQQPPLAVGKTHKFWTQAPKESLTTWSVISREYRNGEPVTRLELRPWTGRTHQLRVHCAAVAALGPIVGDDIYGNIRRGGERQGSSSSSPLCLHAMKLCIYHPISKAPMIFEVGPPF